MNKQRNLFYILLILPCLGFGQWGITGGLTLNKPSFTDYCLVFAKIN